jgi:hypothetical protein
VGLSSFPYCPVSPTMTLCTTCLHVYDYTSSRPNLPEPYYSLSASTCDYATPALVHFRRASRVALLSTDVR